MATAVRGRVRPDAASAFDADLDARAKEEDRERRAQAKRAAFHKRLLIAAGVLFGFTAATPCFLVALTHLLAALAGHQVSAEGFGVVGVLGTIGGLILGIVGAVSVVEEE